MLYRRIVLCALLCLLMASCANRAPAPIVDRSARDAGGSAQGQVVSPRPAASAGRDAYIVQRGDTLYAIAFRYGLDYRRFAAANRIPRPFTIYPGQRLQLAEAGLMTASPTTNGDSDSAVSAAAAVGTGASKAEPARPPSGPSPAPAVTKQVPRNPPAQTGNADKPVAAATPAAVQGKENQPVKKWRWPANGKLVRGFDGSLHKGIDISGKRGDAVLATAAGRIVYAGSGIAGYGLMLIVRHNDVYLSAYGHNDALLVGEGDLVRAGQTIAKRGSSGTDAVKLHFEIRRGGRPVDPLKLLPRQ